MLTDAQLKDVCLLYHTSSQTCRYLGQDELNPRVFHCMKQFPPFKKDADKTVEKIISECKAAGINPDDEGYPLGDNCRGYPLIKDAVQGYDQP